MRVARRSSPCARPSGGHSPRLPRGCRRPPRRSGSRDLAEMPRVRRARRRSRALRRRACRRSPRRVRLLLEQRRYRVRRRVNVVERQQRDAPCAWAAAPAAPRHRANRARAFGPGHRPRDIEVAAGEQRVEFSKPETSRGIFGKRSSISCRNGRAARPAPGKCRRAGRRSIDRAELIVARRAELQLQPVVGQRVQALDIVRASAPTSPNARRNCRCRSSRRACCGRASPGRARRSARAAAAASRRRSRMQPGSTRASRLGSMSMTWCRCREKSMQTATLQPWPARLVPPPRARIGASWLAADARPPRRPRRRLRGKTTPIGTCR